MGSSNRYSRNAPAPIASTVSYADSVRRIDLRRHDRCPANSGWSWGKPARRTNGSCHTGQRNRSASATIASQSSRVSHIPTTSAGDRASATSAASSSTCSGATDAERSTRAGEPAASSSAGSDQSPIGTTTSAGPAPAMASL